MTRLIDADALLHELLTSSYPQDMDINRAYRIFQNELSAAPTVDAVEVVRCKNCRWYDKVDWCNKLRISGVKAVEDTWFCAEGERREE